jgi:hypothetical protein
MSNPEMRGNLRPKAHPDHSYVDIITIIIRCIFLFLSWELVGTDGASRTSSLYLRAAAVAGSIQMLDRERFMVSDAKQFFSSRLWLFERPADGAVDLLQYCIVKV